MGIRFIIALFIGVYSLNSWGSFYNRSIVPSDTRKVKATTYADYFKDKRGLKASVYNIKKADKILGLFSHKNFKALYGGDGSGFWVELDPQETQARSVNEYSYFLILSKGSLDFEIEELKVNIDPSEPYAERIEVRSLGRVNSYALNQEGSKREHWFSELEKNRQYDILGKDNFNIIFKLWAKRSSLVESFHEVNMELIFESGQKQSLVFLISPAKIKQFSIGPSKRYFAPSIPYVLGYKESRGFLKSIVADSDISIEISRANRVSGFMDENAKVPELLRRVIQSQERAQDFFINQSQDSYNWLAEDPYSAQYASQFKLSNMSTKSFIGSGSARSVMLPSRKISIIKKKPFYKIFGSDYSNRISHKNELLAFQNSKSLRYKFSEAIRYFDIKAMDASGGFQEGVLDWNSVKRSLLLGPYLNLYFLEPNSVEGLDKLTVNKSLSFSSLAYSTHDLKISFDSPVWLALEVKKLTDRKVALSNWMQSLGDVRALNQNYRRTYSQNLLMGEFFSTESLLSQIELLVTSGKVKEAMGLCYSKKVDPVSLRACFYLAMINKRLRYAELLLKTNKTQFSLPEFKEMVAVLYFEKFDELQLQVKTDLEKILLDKIKLLSFKKVEVLQEGAYISAIDKNEQKPVQLYEMGLSKKIELSPTNEYEVVLFFDNSSLVYSPQFSLVSNGVSKKSYPVIRTKEPILKTSQGGYLTKGQTFSVSGVSELEIKSNVKAYYKLYQVMTYGHTAPVLSYGKNLKHKSVGRTYSLNSLETLEKVSKVKFYNVRPERLLAQTSRIKLKFKTEDEESDRSRQQALLDLCLSAQSVGKKFGYLEKLSVESPFYSRCANTIHWKERDPFNRDNRIKINSSTTIKEVSELININKYKKLLMSGYFIASPEKNYKVTKSKDNDFVVNYKVIIPEQAASCRKPYVYLESSLGQQQKKDIKLNYGDSLVFETKNNNGCIYLISVRSEDSSLVYSSDAISVRKFESNYDIRLNPEEGLKLNRYMFDTIESQYFYNSNNKPVTKKIECSFSCYDKYYFGKAVQSNIERNPIDVIEFDIADNPSFSVLPTSSQGLLFDGVNRTVGPSSLDLDYTYRTLDQEFGGSGLFKKVLDSNPASTYFLRYRKKITSKYIHLFAGLSDIQDSDFINYELGLNINGTALGLFSFIDSYRLQFKSAYADGFEANMIESRLSLAKKLLVGYKLSVGLRGNAYLRSYENEALRGDLFLREYFSNYQLDHKSGATAELRVDKKVNLDRGLVRYSVATKVNEFNQRKLLDRVSHGLSYSQYGRGLESRFKLSHLYYLKDEDRAEGSEDLLFTIAFKYDNYLKRWGGLSPFARATYYNSNKEYAFRVGFNINLDKSKPFYHHASHENAFLKYKRSRYEY